MTTYLISEILTRLLHSFKKGTTKVLDPWDIALKKLDALDHQSFKDIFKSYHTIKKWSVVYKSIDVYTTHLETINFVFRENKKLMASLYQLEPFDIPINEFFIDKEGRYVDVELELMKFKRAVTEFISHVKDESNRQKQPSQYVVNRISTNIIHLINQMSVD
jgi:hypothetical protein